MTDSICWECKNAVPSEETGCSWSRDFVPVEGWEAVRRYIKAFPRGVHSTYNFRESYCVKRCPLFARG